MFALPVLRQGDLPLLREHRVSSERLLVEAEGWHGTLFLLAKSVTARELEQEGAGGRVGLDGRDWGVTIAEMRGAAVRQPT